MPNWKKLVTSGSSPTFNHVTASGNISGSSTSTGSFGDLIIAGNGNAYLEVAGDISSSGDYYGSRAFGKTTSTEADYDGDVVYFGDTTSMNAGRIYCFKSDGTWSLSNADAVATSNGLLGVALGAASNTNGMLLRGMVTLDHDPGSVGAILYVQSDNAGTTGHATVTAPSAAGDCVRVVGYCLDADDGQIWFNPDNTWVEVA